MIPRLPRSFRRRHGWEAILLGALLVWLASSLAVLPTTARTEHVRILLADRGAPAVETSWTASRLRRHGP